MLASITALTAVRRATGRAAAPRMQTMIDLAYRLDVRRRIIAARLPGDGTMEVARDDSHEADLQRMVTRIADGDRAAEDALVQRFQRGVALLARQHARPNEHRVADVVQTVLMNTIERLRAGALRDAAALPGYLRTSVINEVTAMYRSKAIVGGEDIAGAENAAELATSDTPESRTAQAQLLRNVLRAIDSLAVPRDREVLIRFYVREEARDAICAALDIDDGHFRRVLFRARERLHEVLGGAA